MEEKVDHCYDLRSSDVDQFYVKTDCFKRSLDVDRA